MNMNMLSMLMQLQSNPMQVLAQRFNIPEGVNVKDPNAILKHLLDSGQVTQGQIDNAKNTFKG